MQITPTTPHLGCVIMASGLGKRFGGNKPILILMGRCLDMPRTYCYGWSFFKPRCCI